MFSKPVQKALLESYFSTMSPERSRKRGEEGGKRGTRRTGRTGRTREQEEGVLIALLRVNREQGTGNREERRRNIPTLCYRDRSDQKGNSVFEEDVNV
jgi:hypothetical protein